MKYLVTGGTGFIGQSLIRALVKQGHEVTALSRSLPSPSPHITWHQGDVRDLESLKPVFSQAFDGLFHVAGLVSFRSNQSEELFDINVRGTENVLECAQEAQTPKVLVVSSVATIGPNKTKNPLDETAPFEWNSKVFHYHRSKFEGEQIALNAANAKTNVIVVNPAFVFGQGDDHSPAMHLIQKLARRKVPFYPPGGACFVGIDNVVDGMILALTQGRSGERYILGGENLTNQMAYQMIAKEVGGLYPRFPLPACGLSLYATLAKWESFFRKTPPRYLKSWAKSATVHHFYSSEKAKRELGYSPVSFNETLSTTVEWMKRNQLL